MKHQKVEKQQQKNQSINHWKNIIDIFIRYIKIHAPQPTKVTANLKSYNIQSKNIECKNIQSKKIQNQILTATIEKMFMAPLDKGLQWVNVKKATQEDLGIFRHIHEHILNPV